MLSSTISISAFVKTRTLVKKILKFFVVFKTWSRHGLYLFLSRFATTSNKKTFKFQYLYCALVFTNPDIKMIHIVLVWHSFGLKTAWYSQKYFSIFCICEARIPSGWKQFYFLLTNQISSCLLILNNKKLQLKHFSLFF